MPISSMAAAYYSKNLVALIPRRLAESNRSKFDLHILETEGPALSVDARMLARTEMTPTPV